MFSSVPSVLTFASEPRGYIMRMSEPDATLARLYANGILEKPLNLARRCRTHDASSDPPFCQRPDPRVGRLSRHRPAPCATQRSRTERTEIRLRPRRMRHLHRADW